MMLADAYQAAAMRTYPGIDNHPQDHNLTLAALGLTGESGEFADVVKKTIFHHHPFTEATRDKLILELGDILWYVAIAAETLDVPLSYVMQRNMQKLEARYPRGFTPEASINRVD